jgi:SAM-dependent methyltransferase
MAVENTVRDYFNQQAERFDAIYATQKPFLQRLVDSFRSVVVERLHLMCNLAPQRGPWTALDVGTGSGRYPIAFARLGATRVVGVDVAKAMTDLAAEEATKAGVAGQCEWITAPFLEFESAEKFDAVVAMGYFDYLDEPLPHLKKMLVSSRHRIFMSFPKRWEIRVPVRKLRFAWERGFVRFYSRGEVERLIAAAGVPPERCSLVDFGRDWIAVVRVDG